MSCRTRKGRTRMPVSEFGNTLSLTLDVRMSILHVHSLFFSIVRFGVPRFPRSHSESHCFPSGTKNLIQKSRFFTPLRSVQNDGCSFLGSLGMKREFRAPIRPRLDPENRKLPRNCSSDPASRRKVSDTRSHCPIVVGGKTSQRSEKPGDLPGRRFFATGSISVRRNPRPRAGEAPSREGFPEQCILLVSFFSPCPVKIG